MSYSLTRLPDTLTAYGIEQVSEVEFAGRVRRVEGITVERVDGCVRVAVANHPPGVALPAKAHLDLSAESVRHLIRRLEHAATMLEAGV